VSSVATLGVSVSTATLPRFDATALGARPGSGRPRGVTAVLRVKNEAASLPWSLPGLLRSCDAVLLVDNGSQDGTVDLAWTLSKELGAEDRLRVQAYPHTISRCGPEHLETPPDSVHSLAYFNNWAFSHVTTSYAVKWDGDMVLTEEGEALLADFRWQVARHRVTLSLLRHPLYVADERTAWLDLGVHNLERFGHPMSAEFSYVKAFEWEFLRFPPGTRNLPFPAGTCLELKYLDGDEFGHWTAPSAFATSARTERKRREYAIFQALLRGEDDLMPGVRRFDAPPGQHVIAHVRDWLRTAPRPLVAEAGHPGA